MDKNYELTDPVDPVELENTELSWTAKGILAYAGRQGNFLPRLTVTELQANSPGRESDDEIEQALEELVSLGLMKVAE